LIRTITPSDSIEVITVSIAAGLFPSEESAFLEAMLANYFNGNRDAGHVCVIDVEDDLSYGVAYYEPALATDRTWYLTMIAVRSDHQGRGRGAALMRYIENVLQAEGQRILLVETSGMPDFALTRRFYTKLGYEEEARVRDYFSAGDDMVLFRKVLNIE